MFKLDMCYLDISGNTFECVELIGNDNALLLCIDYVGDLEGLYPDEHHEGFTIMVDHCELNLYYNRFIDMDAE